MEADPQILFKAHGISPDFPGPRQRRAASLLMQVYFFYDAATRRSIEELAREDTWGLALEALNRLRIRAEGSLCAFLADHFCGEIVARSVVEASVTLEYMLADQRAQRFYAYLSNYLDQEERELQSWSGLLDKLPPDSKEAHKGAIDQKRDVLARGRNLIDPAFNAIGVDTSSKVVWPNIFERFRAVGREVEYRTVYAALSTQVHHGAEDLLNSFVVGSLGDARLRTALTAETELFSWHCVTLGLLSYFDAVAAYLDAFAIEGDFAEYRRLYTGMTDLVKSSGLTVDKISQLAGKDSASNSGPQADG